MTLYNNLDYIIDNYVASHKPNGRKTGGNEMGRKKRENSRTSMELLFLLSAKPERAFSFLRGENVKKGKPQQQPLSRGDGPLEGENSSSGFTARQIRPKCREKL